MQAGIIINPAAGRSGARRAEAHRRRAEAALARYGVEGQVRLTERRGSAGSLARSMLDAGAGTVVAWGGDGTINEVASEARAAGAALGVVPGGSGNGFAHGLGLARPPEEALRIALSGDERVIDTGTIDERLFVNVAGIGFDAHLAGVFNDLTTRGPVAYFRAGLRELLSYRAVRYRVRTADATIEAAAYLLAIANGPTYGAGMMIAPGARADDGLLDLVIVPERSLPWLLWHLPYLFAGRADRVPGVRHLPESSIEIEADRPLVFHVDGEVYAARGGGLRVSVNRSSLRVRVPAPSRPVPRRA
ncbi:MAG: diacylglycerol kinase family lipid kinase [Acidobacteria bacterium]|nr:diacylglycerol kinase family lipid kinase [Acidobacteriota bacterium]